MDGTEPGMVHPRRHQPTARPVALKRNPQSNPLTPGIKEPESWRPVGLPELRQSGPVEAPPQPFKRLALGYDMRTLRKQVEELQEEVEKRLDYQERLYAQNRDLWNQLNVLAENNEANSEAAKLFLSKLVGEIKRLEADQIQYKKKVTEAEKMSVSLEAVAREKKALEERSRLAANELHELEENLNNRLNENKALQEKLLAQQGAVKQVEDQLREAAFRKREADLAARIAAMQYRGTRGLRRAFALLTMACARQKKIKDIAQRFSSISGWIAAEKAFICWLRFTEVQHFTKLGIFRRERELLCELFLKWRIFTALSKRSNAETRRLRISRCFEQWLLFHQQVAVAKDINWKVSALQRRWLCRRHLLAWHNLCCFESSWNTEDIKQKLQIAIYYHLWKIFRHWRIVICTLKKSRVAAFLNITERNSWRLLQQVFSEWWNAVFIGKHRNARLKHKGFQQFHQRMRLNLQFKDLENSAVSFWLNTSARKVFSRLAVWVQASQTFAATRRRVLGMSSISSLKIAQAHWAQVKFWKSMVTWHKMVGQRVSHRKQMKQANRYFWRRKGQEGLHALKVLHSFQNRCRHQQRHQRLATSFKGWTWYVGFVQQTRAGAVAMSIAFRISLRKRQAKYFLIWKNLSLSQSRASLLGTFLAEQRRRKKLRLCWSAWLLAWMRSGQQKVDRICEEVERIRGKMQKEESRQHRKEVSKKKLADAVRELAQEMDQLQEQKNERDQELQNYRQDLQRAAINEAKLREEIETKEHELKVLEANYERVSVLESNQLEEQVKVEAQKAQARHQEMELLQAMRGVETTLQQEVATAEHLAQEAIEELEKARERDDRALQDSISVSQKYKDALKKKEMAIKDMEKEYATLKDQLHERRQEYKDIAAQHERIDEEQENKIRKAESEQSVLHLKLSQVEARAREAEGMAREKEREAALLTEEIRRMKAEREVLENIQAKEKTYPTRTSMNQNLSSSSKLVGYESDDSTDISTIATTDATRMIGSLQRHLKDNDKKFPTLQNLNPSRLPHPTRTLPDYPTAQNPLPSIPYNQNQLDQQSNSKFATASNNVDSLNQYSTLQNSIEELQKRILNRLHVNDTT